MSVKGEGWGVSDGANRTFFKTSTGIHLCLLHDLVRTTGERKYQNKRKCTHDRGSHQDGEACQMLQNTLLCPWFWPQLLQGNIDRLNKWRREEPLPGAKLQEWEDLFLWYAPGNRSLITKICWCHTLKMCMHNLFYTEFYVILLFWA